MELIIMNTRQSKIHGLVAVGLLSVCGGAQASDITYTLNIPTVGDLTVAGTITTDGNMGPLTAADFVAFDFSEDSPSIPYAALFSTLTVNPAGTVIFGVGADATGLYMNSSAAGGGDFGLEVGSGPGEYSYIGAAVEPGDYAGSFCGPTAVSCVQNSVTYNGGPSDSAYVVNPYSGSGPTYFATNGVAAVPEPENYGMLLAGLGLIAAAVRRRKSG
jgi:PEP-CTERM motif